MVNSNTPRLHKIQGRLARRFAPTIIIPSGDLVRSGIIVYYHQATSVPLFANVCEPITRLRNFISQVGLTSKVVDRLGRGSDRNDIYKIVERTMATRDMTSYPLSNGRNVHWPTGYTPVVVSIQPDTWHRSLFGTMWSFSYI